MKDFCLFDDVFFAKCLDGRLKAVELMARIILGDSGITITEATPQAFQANLSHRSVSLDILGTDSRGRHINIEVQKDDRGAAVRRAEYHGSMVDAATSAKNGPFAELRDIYIVMATLKDVFGRGRPIYHLDRYIRETGDLPEQGIHIIYVNAECLDEATDLGKLMHDMLATNPDEMYFDELRELVRYYKDNEKGASEMSSLAEELMMEGESNRAAAVAMNMLAEGDAPDKIARCVMLPLEDVLKLKTERDRTVIQ